MSNTAKVLLKKLLCSHYFEEDIKEVLLQDGVYKQWLNISQIASYGPLRKPVICNKCSKMKIVKWYFKDIEYLKDSK